MVSPEGLQVTAATDLLHPRQEYRTSLSHAISLPPPKTFLAPKPPRAHGFPEHVIDEHMEDGQTLSSAQLHTSGHNGGSYDHYNRGASIRPLELNTSSGSGDSQREVHESLARPSHSSLDTDDPGEKAAYKSPTSGTARKRRNYTFLPPSGVNFFLKGHAMTGGDSPLPLLASILLVCGVSGCWIATTGVWLWKDGKRYGLGSGGIAVVIVFTYLLISTISSMVGAAFRDPGILPREFDLQPPVSYSSSSDLLTPLPRGLRVRNELVTVKYCETCKIYRPPRSSHCRLCGNCVEGIDHHCTYLRNCIGKRNYMSFLAFVSWASLATVYEVIFSALHFAFICSEDRKTFKQSLQQSPGAAVSFAIGIVVVWPILALLVYHIRLIYLNSTTIEQIRSQSAKGVLPGSTVMANPFSYHSIARNILSASLGRPRLPSWIDPSGIHRADERKVNPGVLARGK